MIKEIVKNKSEEGDNQDQKFDGRRNYWWFIENVYMNKDDENHAKNNNKINKKIIQNRGRQGKDSF